MLQEFRMPDAGEGLTEAEVREWRVSEGDTVVVNQVLLEVETAKAAVELPSPYAGTVVALLARAGDTVPVGQPIITIEDGREPAAGGSPEDLDQSVLARGASSPAPGAAAPEVAQPGSAHPGSAQPGSAQPGSAHPGGAPDAAGPGRTPVLVGYGVRDETAPRRRPRATPHGAEHVEPGPPGARARPVRYGGLEQARAVEQRMGSGAVRAKPPVRRLARDLGVDLDVVVPTGPGGTITHDDVARAAAAGLDTDVRPLSHVARMMGRAMTESAFSAPHVSEWVDVDVTAMTALIRAARAHPDWAAPPLTALTFAALGLVRAALAHPSINASLDADAANLLVHREVNLGIAVDSPRGLVVPHVAHAQDLDLRGIAEGIAQVVATARAGRSRPEELRGSTITLTNVGVFGVDGGTPILNPGEVAILALGRVLPRPWGVDGAVVARDVVTLALSFDHRVVDGALGARVLREVGDFMADPATALALG